MLAIFNTIGQLVDGLCRDHTIAKGLSLKFATSGGLELEAQWAGRQSEGLVTAFALHYSGLQTKRLCTQDRRGGSWWGVRVILYPTRLQLTVTPYTVTTISCPPNLIELHIRMVVKSAAHEGDEWSGSLRVDLL